MRFSATYGYPMTEIFLGMHMGTEPFWVTARVWMSKCWDAEPATSIFAVFKILLKIISEISSLYGCKTLSSEHGHCSASHVNMLMHSSKQQAWVWAGAEHKEKAIELLWCKCGFRKETQLFLKERGFFPICHLSWCLTELFQGNSGWMFHSWSF